jgi:hypothetical protein
MTILLTTQLIASVALIITVVALALRWRAAQRLPIVFERTVAKGSPFSGLIYAFTLGMAPWAKESTRIHYVAYLRGIFFHVGIFLGLGALLISFWWNMLPTWLLWLIALVTGLGALSGFMGNVMRRAEHNLRALSSKDDHASVFIVSLWLATMTIALLDATWLPTMYVVAAAMLIYMPISKIRHCIYFFFSRRFFGLFIGRRAVVHPQHVEVMK